MAHRLEEAVRRGLPGPAAGGDAARKARVRKLLSSLDRESQPKDPQEVQVAVQHLLDIAPNRKALELHLGRLGGKVAKELVLLLYLLDTDQQLSVLTKAQHAPAAGPADALKATAASLRATTPAGAPQLPATAQAHGYTARQASAARPASLSQGRIGNMPGSGPTASAAGAAQAEPAAIEPPTGSNGVSGARRRSSSSGGLPHANTTSMATPAAASRPAQASEPSPMQISPPVMTASGRLDMQPAQLTAGRQQPYAAHSQFNPVFGQEDALTPPPPVRSREYTPSLSTGMAAASLRAAASVAQPVLTAVGDLFTQQPQQQGNDQQQQECAGAGVGPLPVWVTARHHLTGQDLVLAAAARQQQQQAGVDSNLDAKLAGMPPGGQEVAVMNDLLYAFMGLDGKYVRATLVQPPGTGCSPSLSYMVQASSLPPCSQELVVRLLPICEYVAVLQRFISTRSGYSHGLVAHAVCAAMRGLLSDWQLVVTQLEHQLRTGQLSLQGLVFYCQGPLASLAVLAGVAAQAAEQQLRGAGLINLLAHQAAALAGDKVARTLLHKLLHAATVPYFKMLEAWVCEGVLHDPYQEFMVQEDKEVGKDALTADKRLSYWCQRYTIRQQPGSSTPDVPTFLHHVQLEILNTGKYLNAMRECGHHQLARPALPVPQLRYDHSAAHSHVTAIHAAHAHASSALLAELRESQQLLPWLRSLKHFFLLDQGDVIVHLAEAARTELSGPAKELSMPRLQSLVELAVKTSSCGQDPHADALLLELEPRSLEEMAHAAGAIKQQHKAGAAPPRLPLLAGLSRRGEVCGWQVVQLSVRLQWPLTLVVPPGALALYQLIFRYLFQLKHAERQLAAAWLRMQAARNASKSDRARLRPAYQLAHRQLYFLQEMLRYSCVAVLEPGWRVLEDRVRRAADVDQVIQCHAAFLQQAVDGLLLSQAQLLSTLTRLQQCTLNFSAQLHAAWDAVEKQQQQQGSQGGGSGAGVAALPPSGRARSSAGQQRPSSSTGQAGASRVPASSTTTSSGAPAAVLDVQGPTHEFNDGLQALITCLQELYNAAMHREAADGDTMPDDSAADSTQLQVLDSRERVEALQGLIQQLQLDMAQQAPPGTAAPQVLGSSNQAIYQQSLQMVAAAEQAAR